MGGVGGSGAKEKEEKQETPLRRYMQVLSGCLRYMQVLSGCLQNEENKSYDNNDI